MPDLLTICGSVAGSVIASLIVAKLRRDDGNDSKIVVIETTLEERAHQRALEERHLEHRLNAIETRLRELGNRYHDMRGVVDRFSRFIKGE